MTRQADFGANGSYLTAKDSMAGAGRQDPSGAKYQDGNQAEKGHSRPGMNGSVFYQSAGQSTDFHGCHDGTGSQRLGGASDAMKGSSGYINSKSMMKSSQSHQYGLNQSKLQKDG